MTIELEIKKELKNVNIEKWKRTFYKVILGEFQRINDGKPCNDKQCLAVIKKMIKNNREIVKFDKNNTAIQNEYAILMNYLPKQADESIMKKIINITLTSQKFKNKMQAMKPCISLLEKMGFDVDKKILSTLLKEKTT